MSPPQRQSVAQISAELGIHMVTLYNWRKGWRLQAEVVPAPEKDPESWCATDKFTMVLETDGLNATELSAYCRERGLFPEQVERWRRPSQNANEIPVLTLKAGGAGTAPRQGSKGNQAAEVGAAPQKESPGGGGSTAECLKKGSGLLRRGR